METLLGNLVLCLLVAFIPAWLVAFTAGEVYKHESLQKLGPLVLLNVFIAILITSAAISRPDSTLATMAVVGYLLVAVMIAVIIAVNISSVWCIKISQSLGRLSRLRRARFRKEVPVIRDHSFPINAP